MPEHPVKKKSISRRTLKRHLKPINDFKIKQHKEKTRLSLTLNNLYSLPLDIKIKIYKMCYDTHMQEWKKEHSKKLKLTNDFLVFDVDFPAIEEHYEDSWRKRKGLIGYLEYYGKNSDDPNNTWTNIKLTRPCHFKFIDKPGDNCYLKPEKIDTYYLDKSQFKPGLRGLISHNEFTGEKILLQVKMSLFTL